MKPVDKLKWLRGLVGDSALSDSAVRVGLFLCLSENDKTGQLNPSIPHIVAETGVSRSSVKRAIKSLSGTWVKVGEPGRGKGNTASYQLITKGSTQNPPKGSRENPLKGSTVNPKQNPKGSKSDTQKGPNPTPSDKYTSLDEQVKGIGEVCGGVQKTLLPEPAKTTSRDTPKKIPPTSETWRAFSEAYRERYGVDPVRNATVNGQLANFVKRIGGEEAPFVAAYYVTSNNSFYVRNGHQIGLMVKDAEKLRTEWITGRQVTQTQAAQADRSQSNYNAAQEAKAILANRSRNRG